MNLKQRIIDEIETDGPIPFERFMEMALYDRQGFFGGEAIRSNQSGDFLTSPEVSPLFGATLAGYVENVRARLGQPFLLVEAGAGTGSLLAPLLQQVDVDALAVEVSPGARNVLAGVVEVSAEMPERMRGVLVANELLDNIPMALAQRVDGAWRERWVGSDGSGGLEFVDADVRRPVAHWLDDYAGPVADGGWVEVQLAARAWLEDAIERMDAGAILLFDYGDLAENLLARRGDGTLRTYRAHHLGPHPLEEPGATDITADVNFSALVDLRPDATTLHRQDDFLASLGLRDRLSETRRLELEAAREGDASRRMELRSESMEIETLLHPRGLGDFRVLEIRIP